MAEKRVWVWYERDEHLQHLAAPPDPVDMAWTAETGCGLEGDLRRVTFENVDGGKACARCVQEPYVLAGDDRGPP